MKGKMIDQIVMNIVEEWMNTEKTKNKNKWVNVN